MRDFWRLLRAWVLLPFMLLERLDRLEAVLTGNYPPGAHIPSATPRQLDCGHSAGPHARYRTGETMCLDCYQNEAGHG